MKLMNLFVFCITTTCWTIIAEAVGALHFASATVFDYGLQETAGQFCKQQHGRSETVTAVVWDLPLTPRDSSHQTALHKIPLIYLLMQCTRWELVCLFHLAVTGSFGLRDVAIFHQHGCRRWRYDPEPVTDPRLQGVVPVVVRHWNHSWWELFRRHLWVPGGEWRHYPDVPESCEAQRTSFLQDQDGLVLGTVEQDDRGLQFLQHDLRATVLLHRIQGDDVLQIPTNKTGAETERTRVKC